MDKPKCRMYGKRHSVREGCSFPDDAVECSECKRKDTLIEALEHKLAIHAAMKLKGTTDRKEYMREYMRKRRAKQ